MEASEALTAATFSESIQKKGIVPQRIEGLDDAAVKGRSIGGKIPLTANIESNSSLSFTNLTSRKKMVTLEVRAPDAKDVMEASKQGKPFKPALIIGKLEPEDFTEDERNALTQKIVAHNAAEIMTFLEKGGDPAEIGQTPYDPRTYENPQVQQQRLGLLQKFKNALGRKG